MRTMYVMICAVLVVSLAGYTQAAPPISPPMEHPSGSNIGTTTDQMPDTAESSGRISSEQMNQFAQKVRSRLADLKKKIADLNVDTEQLQGQAKAKLQKVAAELKTKLQAAEQQFGNLQNVSDETWQKMRVKLEEKLKRLEQAHGEAIKKLKNSASGQSGSSGANTY